MVDGSYLAVLILSATLVTCAVKLNRTHICNLKVDYVIGNNCTEHKNISVIQIVTSYAGNFQKRQVLRDIYSQLQLANLGIYRVFLLASTTNRMIQENVTKENNKFGDIVQGDFIDAYRNLTYKNLMGLKWVTLECPHISHVIKSDDDVVIDFESLKKLIEMKKTSDYDMMGCGFKNRVAPYRNSTHRWYVSPEEYEEETYPVHFFGFLVVVTAQAAERLFVASESEKYLWIDDVFIFGILAEKIDLKTERICEYVQQNTHKVKSCVRNHSECDFVAGYLSEEPSLATLYRLYLDTHPHRDPTRPQGNTWQYPLLVCLALLFTCVCVYLVLIKVVFSWVASKYTIYN